MENNKIESPNTSKLPPLNARAESPPDDGDDMEGDAEPVDLVRVVNTQPRLLHLPDAVRTSSGPEGPRIAGVGTGKSLQPGGNNVPRAAWEAAKGQPYGEALRRTRDGHKEVRTWIRLGWLKEEGDVSQPEGPQAPTSLLSYSPPVAIAMAEGEDDSDVLMRWLKVERRPEVQEALKRQIESRGASKRKPRARS